jgi:hypothetical protein
VIISVWNSRDAKVRALERRAKQALARPAEGGNDAYDNQRLCGKDQPPSAPMLRG